MSDLPSKDDWLEALRVASESTAIDLVTAGRLDEVRHAIAVGQLVDREAIDYEVAGVEIRAILREYLREIDVMGLSPMPKMAKRFAAALGVTDE